MKNNFSGQSKVEYVNADTGKSLGETLPAGHKVIPQPKDGKGTATDWLRWAMAGGGGLLAYQLASNLMGSDEKKKEKSVWEKLLGILLPIGVGAAGAAGGYALGGLGQKKASSVKSAQTNAYARVNLGGQDIAANDPNFKNKWYELIATRAQEDGITMEEAARQIVSENRGSATAANWAALGLGTSAAGTGVAAGLKARESAIAQKNPLFPTKTEIGAHRNAVKMMTDRIGNATTSPADSMMTGNRLRAVREAFAPKQELLGKATRSKAVAGKLGWLAGLQGLLSAGALAKGLYDEGDADNFAEANRRLSDSAKKWVP